MYVNDFFHSFHNNPVSDRRPFVDASFESIQVPTPVADAIRTLSFTYAESRVSLFSHFLYVSNLFLVSVFVLFGAPWCLIADLIYMPLVWLVPGRAWLRKVAITGASCIWLSVIGYCAFCWVTHLSVAIATVGLPTHVSVDISFTFTLSSDFFTALLQFFRTFLFCVFQFLLVLIRIVQIVGFCAGQFPVTLCTFMLIPVVIHIFALV